MIMQLRISRALCFVYLTLILGSTNHSKSLDFCHANGICHFLEVVFLQHMCWSLHFPSTGGTIKFAEDLI